MSDCFVLYLLLTCMKKKTSGADKFTNNSKEKLTCHRQILCYNKGLVKEIHILQALKSERR